MHESSVKDPKMEGQKNPRKGQPEQFQTREHDADFDQPVQDDRDTNRQFAGKEYGEGNYKAAKEYDDATRDFVRSGRVADSAKDAEPRSAEEARELAEAEAQGRMRSKGEDASAQPALKKRKQKSRR